MNSQQKPITRIPADIYQEARQIYNLNHIYLLIGDQLEEILTEINLAQLDPFASQEGEAISRLSMVTAFQYAEHLPDMVASDATRKRMDWKYALHLPVHHQGIAAQALCDFRQTMFSSPHAMQEFDRLLDRLGRLGLYDKITRDNLKSETVLVAVCNTTRLQQLYTGTKSALSILVSVAPDWLRANAPAHWYERYKARRGFQTPNPARQSVEQEAERLGADFQCMLAALGEQNLTSSIDQAEYEHLTQLWKDQFVSTGDQVHWRTPGCANCSRNTLGEFES